MKASSRALVCTLVVILTCLALSAEGRKKSCHVDNCMECRKNSLRKVNLNSCKKCKDGYEKDPTFHGVKCKPIPKPVVNPWILIQKRVPTPIGAEEYDWQKTWAEYKAGFGDPTQNFWLGLEEVHQLTSSAPYRLRIDVLQQKTNIWFTAKYENFSIGDEANSKYTLHVEGYSGTGGDSLNNTGNWNGFGCLGCFVHNGEKFSTIDEVNAPPNITLSCVGEGGGGWWYATKETGSCYLACLTCNDAHTEWDSLSNSYDTQLVSAAMMRIQMKTCPPNIECVQ